MFALIALLAVNANAATFVVNTTSDTQDAAPGNGVCADVGGMCSLRAAIREANALAGPDTITLPAGTYTTTLVAANEDGNLGGDLDITSPMTINGAGAGTTIVQANAATQTANERVFHILAGGTLVTISDVTIQNGVFRYVGATPNPQGGGGVRVEGATANLTINNSTITGNYSENRGGGITANKANLTISGCTFTNNSAGSGVAGSASSGGAISVDSEDNLAAAGQTASITNTIINNNKAESSVSNTFGGGLAVRALNANVTVTGCTIFNNLSNALNLTFSGFAGGISNQQATMTVTGSDVSFNTSSRFHAGIRNLSSTAASSTLNIVNSTVSNNTSTVADASGGGVSNISGAGFTATTTIDRSTISTNILTGATSVGGGVLNTGNSSGTAAMNIVNSTVSGNSAHDAGGVYSDGSAANCVINFSTVARNAADGTSGEGGGIFQDVTFGGTTVISNSISADNTASVGVDVNDLAASGDYNHIENPAVGFPLAAHDVTGDPALGLLGNNGGPTQTHLPGGASVVLNTIPNGTNGCGGTFVNDQRGLVRPAASGCEKGSVEVQVGGPTATNTPTPSATATNTPTATPTSSGTPSISGTITYGNAIGSPNPRFVSNVLLSAAGSVNVSATSDFPGGNYVLTGFGSGSYTVTPSKTGGQNGITSFDAAKIAQHVAGIVLLNANQLIAADTSDNGQISSFDSALLARFVIGAPSSGVTGTWRFLPVNRSYATVTGTVTGEDFVALLMGEVSGNWTNTGAKAHR